MRKVINIVLLGIPYLIKCIQIVNALKTKIDINKDGKISTDEVLNFINSWETIEGKDEEWTRV